MLKLSDPIDTPFGLNVAGTVWRWVGLQIDAGAGQAVIVICAYPSAEIAAAVGTQAVRPPLVEERYAVGGIDFGAIVLAPPSGPTLSDAVSSAIYAHLRRVVPKFQNAEDVGIPGG